MSGRFKTHGEGEVALRRIIAEMPDGTIEEWRAAFASERQTTLTRTALFKALRRLGIPRRPRRGRHANGRPALTSDPWRSALRAAIAERPRATVVEYVEDVARATGHRFSVDSVAVAVRREAPGRLPIYTTRQLDARGEELLRALTREDPEASVRDLADELSYRLEEKIGTFAVDASLHRLGLRPMTETWRRLLGAPGSVARKPSKALP